MRKLLLSASAIALATAIGTAQNPLPNAGFEQWTEFNVPIQPNHMQPDNWDSSNSCTELLGTYAITRSDDHHSGQYSAQLRTRNAFIQEIRINGLLTTSEVVCGANTGGITGGINSDLIPDSVVFWYKYTPAGIDTAYVQVVLLNGNDTVSYTKGNITDTVDVWTRASFPITPPTGTPSIISTLFNSSWGDGSQGQAVVNSTFKVDDVEFIFPTGIEREHLTGNWEVFPNPMSDILNIRNNMEQTATLEMLDITGRTVLSRPITQTQTTVDVSALPQGIYLYQLRDGRSAVLRTGKLIKGL